MIVKAKKSDIEQIMKIMSVTVEEMKSYNNVQWDESYPQAKDYMRDIEKGDLYVTKDGEEIMGFICVDYNQPEEYRELEWSSDEKCMVVHRMAINSNYRRQGIGTKLMKFAENLALEKGVKYLKTDTYSVNEKMDALFKKCGFRIVGEIRFPGKEKPFYCYEKLLVK